MILVLNGPNLGSLGKREPEIYGSATLADLEAQLKADAATLPEPVEIELRQTDHEGELIGWLHKATEDGDAVILNAGAWTHYSYALHDAVAHVTSSGVRLIEVHLSNPHSREEFRHKSVITDVASGVIAGFGFDSYRLALVQLSR